MTKRTLSLKREALTELAVGDLAAVVAGEAPSGYTCPVRDCLLPTNAITCLTCLTNTCW